MAGGTKHTESDAMLAREASAHEPRAWKVGRLDGDEIRLLPEVLGYSSADFARLLAASPVTVSRWGHDAQPIGHLTDALLRILVEATFVTGFDRACLEKVLRDTGAVSAAPAHQPTRGCTPLRAMKLSSKTWRPAERPAA